MAHSLLGYRESLSTSHTQLSQERQRTIFSGIHPLQEIHMSQKNNPDCLILELGIAW